MPSFAIIIPTAGRLAQLKLCLASLDQAWLSDPRVRVLVIDNNCERDLANSVRDTVKQFPGVEYEHCSRPGLSSARHHALRLLDSDVLCYVDDDVLFSETWLESTRSAFMNSDIALAGGPTIPDFQGSIPSWFWDFLENTPYGGWCCPWLSLLDIGEDVNDIHPNWIWGLNFSIRRKALLDCGGFHIDLVPKQYMRWQGDGETGLTIKLAARGYKAAYHQTSLLFHQCGPDRLNPDYFAKRAFYQGVCNSYTYLRNQLRSELHKDVLVLKSSLLKTAVRRTLNTIRKRLAVWPILSSSVSKWAHSAKNVRSLCQQAEWEGYLFHQREAASDPALREWITQDTYFEVDLRDLRSSD